MKILKNIYILLLGLVLFIPFYVKAEELEKFSYDKANIYFEIDKDVWHYKDFEENKDDVWTSDCGTMTGGIQDIYSGLSEEKKGGFSRNQYNYRNLYSSKEDAEYIAKAWADNYKNELGLDNVDWEIKDFGVVFIYLKGSTGSGENKVSFEQYFTTNNGYGIVLQNMVTSRDNAVCSQSLEDIAKTARITDYTSSELNVLSIVIDLFLTIICYLIYPFVRIKIMKHEYNEKQLKNMILWNSIIVGLIFAIITYSLYGSSTTTNVINFAPAVFYYYINRAIWLPGLKQLNIKKGEQKQETYKCSECGATCDHEFIICPNCKYDFSKVKSEDNSKMDEKSFVCDNCGGKVKENAKKCPHCGGIFDDENDDNSKTMVCSNCGIVVNHSVKKCPQCGEKFDDEGNDKNKEEKESSNIDQKYSDLNKLKELLDNDVITKEEFDKEKKKVLNDK